MSKKISLIDGYPELPVARFELGTVNYCGKPKADRAKA